MIVAGVMSGTSADGINVALVRLSGAGARLTWKLLSHQEYPYPPVVRRAVLAAMDAKAARVADLARLNVLLAGLYADAVLRAQRSARVRRIDLVGCHGQTLYHQGEAAPFLGQRITTTWQTGEGAVIAARTGVPVVSDFRPADMAAGGKGAPLVPFLDYLLFRDPRRGRIVQNLGGIANLTGIPAGAAPERVIAFDTGPGNMVIDGVMQQLFGRSYDRDAAVAEHGRVREDVLRRLLRAPYFRRRPPKTAGREEFGRDFVARVLRLCAGAPKEDVVATATALTAASIEDAVRHFIFGRRRRFSDYIASGGGTRNPALMRMLRERLEPLGLRVHTTDAFGLPSVAKEAVAFAVLAYQTWHRRPGNIPSATGALRPAILGKISYV